MAFPVIMTFDESGATTTQPSDRPGIAVNWPPNQQLRDYITTLDERCEYLDTGQGHRIKIVLVPESGRHGVLI